MMDHSGDCVVFVFMIQVSKLDIENVLFEYSKVSNWYIFLYFRHYCLVGLDINWRVMGSEIVYDVIGDDAGGGPNSDLPVLIYLVNRRELMESFILIKIVPLIVNFIINFYEKRNCV